MFHANFVHILGNLWSFWIFGNNIEDKLGKLKFIIFLIFTGVVSMFSHIILNTYDINPIVGASGIVSALMGAYLYLFPNAQLLVLVPFGFLFPTTIKAKFFMIFWFISQIFIAIQNTNISWEAHIGGFIVGYLILKIFNYRRYTI
jgi:membrane associated rhomboid family serine protease